MQQAKPTDGADPASIFQGTLTVEEKLERARTELLDLSARNRLLNIPQSAKAARSLEIVDERSDEIFRLMVRESRAFTFLAGRPDRSGVNDESPDAEEIVDLAQPDDESVDDRGILSRHADTRLQTRMTPSGLQKRLLDLNDDARTLEEEQGVNILFLALGTLKWIDPINAANIRFAPLILIPVALERGNAAEKFKLRWRQEEPAANLSLEAFLDRVHGLKLPPFDTSEDFDPASYLAAVAEAITAKAGWSVQPNHIVLGFFSFAKFLMYRDLDASVWPTKGRISDQPLIRALLADGFEAPDELVPDDVAIDPYIAPADMLHIVDSDSSQTLAVHEVRRGRNLVIQGPPGTGKSQTIANIIASAIADGKTVLFLAEKMAALEVVKRRLDTKGVGDACLELHSNKANKRALLEELRRTWQLGTPKGDWPDTLNARLVEARDRLNAHAERLHRANGKAGLTPYAVIGQLTRLKQDGHAPNDIVLGAPTAWSRVDFSKAHEAVSELAERVADIGRPIDHEWHGIGLKTVLPAEVDRFARRIAELALQIETIDAEQSDLAAMVQLPKPSTFAALGPIENLTQRIADSPLSGIALGASVWERQRDDIASLVETGELYGELAQKLTSLLNDGAWEAEISTARSTLEALPMDFPTGGFEIAGRLDAALPGLIETAVRLTRAMGQSSSTTLAEIERAIIVGERVAAAPDASPDAFVASVWDRGVQQASDLVDAVEALASARQTVGSQLNDAAWSQDFAQARITLAAHGTGMFRWLNGTWRNANRLVRSMLTNGNLPLAETLAVLDALARGQAALRVIRDDDAFGRAAFDLDWRGERTDAAPLRALVEWMHSLRGLGAEPRLIAGNLPNRSEVGALASRAKPIAGDVRAMAQALFELLAVKSALVFDNDASGELSSLGAITDGLVKIGQARSMAVAVLRDVPESLLECCRQLADLSTARIAAERLANADALGTAAFGPEWLGKASIWQSLRTATDWVFANSDIRTLASGFDDRGAPAGKAAAIRREQSDFLQKFGSLLNDLRADIATLLGSDPFESTPIQAMSGKLHGWTGRTETLSRWVAYSGRAVEANAAGLDALVDRLHDGRLAPTEAIAAFEMSYYEAIFADQVAREPELATFDGDLHSRRVSEFAAFDQQRIEASSLEVVRAHHRQIPPRSGGTIGPLGTLRAEMERKRGHLPIRQLMQRAAPAIQALKPVFMMSPLSIAQFLPPGALTFDLLVMDEASQIQPVDALGAVARCRQVVVVGDPKQLPPTAFFAKVTGNAPDDDGEDDGAKVADIESILGLFSARGLPTRMLRWHYRSRHQSLIAVSNRQFYEDKLFIVPSPHTTEAGMGLRFHHVADGIFETGTTRTNPIEAKIIAQAIITHARNSPELSLGVATFSAAQRRAIFDQVELLRRGLALEDEAFFQAHYSEPFFIKNLENVQGDERDVIFISVGYGPSVAGGAPAMRFGPLGTEGGERRLNVLISRAKRRCEVFSSITDEQIDPDFASSRKGVFAFKLFLHFARTGRLAMSASTGRDHDSVFEEQVARALHARGYQVKRQVGIAGFFIDLAIADPDYPDRYVLGIECDGAPYHESRSARDRDRLRQSVLEDHGWAIHRIWSTDWFQRPLEQLEKVARAIETAKAELAVRDEAMAVRTRAVPIEIVTIEREDVTEIGLVEIDHLQSISSAYVEAVPVKPPYQTAELHAAPLGLLTAMAEQVVAVEGPVHVDEVVNRIREAWGLKRAGGRIQESVEAAINVAVLASRLRKDGDFLAVPGAAVAVRDRTNVKCLSLRRPETLPPAEIRKAIIEIVRLNMGATADQILQAVSRALGFRSTKGLLRGVIRPIIFQALAEHELIEQHGVLVIGPAAQPAPIVRPGHAEMERLIAEGEHERLEFKQTLCWDIVLNQRNKKLEDVVIKTVAAFTNGVGGTLLIGVNDDGIVTGLDCDFKCLGGNVDKIELHLTNQFGKHFGQAFRASRINVSFPFAGPAQICKVDVKPASSAMFVTLDDKAGQMAERFFVRSGNSSQELSPSETARYIKERFG